MNALPLVSVVVPNYNYKRYLNLRIQSILQQTYQNIKLILLDYPQYDGSEEVLSDYHANTIILSSTSPHAGKACCAT